MVINNTLGERVFEKLKDDILAGVYKPGDRLYYEKIASALNVSMTPVKEALLRLEQEGMVRTIPRKGTYVIELTDRDIIEYTHIRFALESLAIDTICKKRIPEDRIRELQPVNEELAKAIRKREMVLCMAKDIEFHHKIVDLSENIRLYDLFKQLPLTNFMALRGTQDWMIEQGEIIIEKHENIVEGLLRYDAEYTKNVLKANILVPQLGIVGEHPEA
ncbi:MAG: GntR family transcriptional regulator [Spirochaetales bacterium]